MRAFAIIKQVGGSPDLDREVTNYHGFVLCAQYQSWGLYLVSGSPAQLLAIAALPASKVVPLCLVSTNESERFPELRDTVLAATRTKLNTWLTARGLPTIPVQATYMQILDAIAKRLNPAWTLEGHDVMDSP